MTVEVVLGDNATPGPASESGAALTPEQKARQEIERRRREVEANPDQAGACNNLAWSYLTAPQALRDAEGALSLAQKAARLDPGNAVYRNTLGLAYYRAGRFREAVEVLRTDLESREERVLAYDLFFLAMCYHQLGETVRARDYYDWAVRSAQLQQVPIHREELSAFRAEAQALLAIDRKED